MTPNVVNVADKVRAFWHDRTDERHLWSVLTSYEVRDLAGVESVVGCCEVFREGHLVARSYSSRALRAPKPGAQGMNDTRDVERVQTQAIGRAMGELGYASGSSLEGDTDEPDESGDHHGVVRVPRAKAKGELVAALQGDTNRAAEWWPFGDARFVSRDELDDLLEQVKTSAPAEGGKPRDAEGDAASVVDSSPVPKGDVPPDDPDVPEGGASGSEGVKAAREALNKGKRS